MASSRPESSLAALTVLPSTHSSAGGLAPGRIGSAMSHGSATASPSLAAVWSARLSFVAFSTSLPAYSGGLQATTTLARARSFAPFCRWITRPSPRATSGAIAVPPLSWIVSVAFTAVSLVVTAGAHGCASLSRPHSIVTPWWALASWASTASVTPVWSMPANSIAPSTSTTSTSAR